MKERIDPGERASLYLGNALEPGERDAFEREALESDELANALYDETNLDTAFEHAATATPRTAGADASVRNRFLRIALPLAASVALLVLVPTTLRQFRTSDVLRGGGAAVDLVAPIGDVASAPREFVWRATPGAATYELVVTDADARVLVRRLVSGTRYVVEDAEEEAVIASGFWTVVARDSSGAEIASSKPQRFRAP
jgi:hypothetical protein